MKLAEKKELLRDAMKAGDVRTQLIADATDTLVELSENENTKDAYHYALKEFTEDYQGQLPCNDEALAGYLSVFSSIHKPATLELRKSMISKWHKLNEHPDPADSELVRKVVRGIRKTFSQPQKQAKALDVIQLEVLVNYFDDIFCLAEGIDHPKRKLAAELKAKRDKAFVLLGYWFGLRSDSLLMIEAEHLSIERTATGKTLRLYQPRSKSDQAGKGRPRTMRSTGFLCPVAAVEDWLVISGIENTKGPVFSKISRWGVISETAIHPKSVNRMLRDYFAAAGLDAALYSSHSMRRGLANFLITQKQTDKEIMDWIGWTDYRSALRYQDAKESLSNIALERYIQERFPNLQSEQFLIT